MARIAGVNIPTNKQVGISLTYIFGIGRTKALKILNIAGVPPDRRVNEMSDAEVAKDSAVAGAANEVGDAAAQVGDAAENAGNAVGDAVEN